MEEMVGGALLLLVVLFFAYLLLSPSINRKKRVKLPPGPSPWPILGNLPHLRGRAPVHLLLRDMAARYGPLMTVWMGSHPTLVISSDEVAHEALVAQGSRFASRPQPPSWVYFSNNFRNSLTSVYGRHWKKLRRVLNNTSSLKLPSAHCPVLHDEVSGLLARLIHGAKPGNDVAPLADIRLALSSVMALACFGEDFSASSLETMNLIVSNIMDMTSISHLPDYIPIARFLPSWRGTHKKYLQIIEHATDFCLPIILACQLKLKASGVVEPACYIETLLSLEETEEENKLSLVDIMWNTIELLVGGIDTVSNTLPWTLAYLVAHPDIQHRAYTEVQGVAGDAPVIDREEQLRRMPYLQAVVKETLRRSGPLVLGVPHATCEEDCRLLGFDVPAKTRVMINQHAVLNDPKVWNDPESFRPERHLPLPLPNEGEGKHNATYSAFGGGRRICPGMNMAKFLLHHLLSNLVLNFVWLPRQPNEAVDLTGQLQFVYSMKNPLQARILQRHH